MKTLINFFNINKKERRQLGNFYRKLISESYSTVLPMSKAMGSKQTAQFKVKKIEEMPYKNQLQLYLLTCLTSQKSNSIPK